MGPGPEGSGQVLPADTTVADLRPEGQRETPLTPETKVFCRNRGTEELHDTFDSYHYAIPVGDFLVSYGAALHFKARAVVPGSRDPISGFQASFIVILGIPTVTGDGRVKIERAIDPMKDWPMFSDAERQQYGLALEAIDRGALPAGDREGIEIIGTGGGNAATIPASASRVKGGGGGGTGGRRGKPDLSARRADGTAVDVTEVLDNPDQARKVDAETGQRQAPRRPNAAMRQMAADKGAADEPDAEG